MYSLNKYSPSIYYMPITSRKKKDLVPALRKLTLWFLQMQEDNYDGV